MVNVNLDPSYFVQGAAESVDRIETERRAEKQHKEHIEEK